MDIRFAVIALRAEDVQAAAHFYREVIGLTPLPHHPEDRPHFKLGEAYLAIIRGRPALTPDPEPPFPVVAFSVSDLDAAIKKL